MDAKNAGKEKGLTNLLMSSEGKVREEDKREG